MALSGKCFLLFGLLAARAAGIMVKEEHDVDMGALQKMLAVLEEDPEISALVKRTYNPTDKSDIWSIVQNLVEEYASADYPLHASPGAMRGFASAVCLRLEKYGREALSTSIDPQKSEIRCDKFEELATTLMVQVQDWITWTETEPAMKITFKKRILAGYLVRAAIMTMENNSMPLWSEVVIMGDQAKNLHGLQSDMWPLVRDYRKHCESMTEVLRQIAKTGDEKAEVRLAKVQWAIIDWGKSWLKISDQVGKYLTPEVSDSILTHQFSHSGWSIETIERMDVLFTETEKSNVDFHEFLTDTFAKTVGTPNGKSEIFHRADYQLSAIQWAAQLFQTRVNKHVHTVVKMSETQVKELLKRLREVETVANQTVAAVNFNKRSLEVETVANQTVAAQLLVSEASRAGLEGVSRGEIELAVKTMPAGDVTSALNILLAKKQQQKEHRTEVAKLGAAVTTAPANTLSKISPEVAAGLVTASAGVRASLKDAVQSAKAINFDLLDPTIQVVRALRACTLPYESDNDDYSR